MTSLNPKDYSVEFAALPAVIQDAAVKEADSQKIDVSAAAVKILSSPPSDKIWTDFAQKCNVSIIDPKNAKGEFLAKYASVKAVGDVLLQTLPDAKSKEFETIKDPFTRLQVIEKYIAANPHQDGLVKCTEALLRVVAAGMDKPEEEQAAVVLVRNGVQGDSLFDWVDELRSAGEESLDIFKASLPFEQRLDAESGDKMLAWLVKAAIADSKPHHLRALVEAGQMPEDSDLASAIHLLKAETDEYDEKSTAQLFGSLKALADQAVAKLTKDLNSVNPTDEQRRNVLEEQIKTLQDAIGKLK